MSPQGRCVGLPYSSWFHQLPIRPIPCASRRPGATASMKAVAAHAGSPHDDDARDRSEEDPTPDPEAAVPDLEDALPFRRRHLVPRGDVVIEARADDAEADAPHGHPDDEVGIASLALPAACGQPDRGEDRDEERQAVEVDRERPDVDDPARRRGDVRERRDHRPGFCRLSPHPGLGSAAPTRAANPLSLRKSSARTEDKEPSEAFNRMYR